MPFIIVILVFGFSKKEYSNGLDVPAVEYETRIKPDSYPEGTKVEALDPNHSHFLLIDDSRLNVFGGEIEARSRVERALYIGNGERQPTPVIVVCIEGGPNTVWQVLKSVGNGIPCLFIEVKLFLFMKSYFKKYLNFV